MKSIFLIFALTGFVSCYSQSKFYTGEDGTEIEVINDNPDSIKKACVYVGRFGLEGINFIGASYYQPKRFFVNLFLGRTGGSIDGSVFFFNTIRNVKTKILISSESSGSGQYRTKTKTYLKVPSSNRLSFGLHMGTSIANYSKLERYKEYFNFVKSPNSPITSHGVFGGLTLLEARQMKYKLFARSKQGSLIRRLNADAIYYYKRDSHTPEINATNIDTYSREVGYRLYYDFKATVVTKRGNFGVNGLLGVGTNSQLINIPIFLGFGIGFSFL